MWHTLRREWAWLTVVLMPTLLAGWLTGHVLWALGLFLVAYTIRQLVFLGRLREQLSAGVNEYPPNGNGIWEEIFFSLYQLRRRGRRRKKRLVRLVERFRNAFAALPDAVVFLGVHDDILWFNAASERLLGLKRSDIGLPIGNLVRSPKFIAFLRENDPAHTVTIPSPVDSNLMLELRLVPYGSDLRLLLAQDVTQLRFMERVRSDFVANVSHELRTPLTVLKGYLETLNHAEDPALARYGKALTRMEEQAGRMQRLIEDLLSLTRLETAAQMPQDQRGVDVVNLLRGICEDAGGLMPNQAAIELRLETDAELIGDEQDLRSAFSNLVVNAVKYTPATGQIIVTWRRDGDGARLDVRDTGEGIAEQHIPRLTERFYRVDAGAGGKVGVGLGLAIVKHVLLRHDGELKITSRLGQGSCFSCCFPAKRLAAK